MLCSCRLDFFLWVNVPFIKTFFLPISLNQRDLLLFIVVALDQFNCNVAMNSLDAKQIDWIGENFQKKPLDRTSISQCPVFFYALEE
jgi:hypothetical protein